MDTIVSDAVAFARTITALTEAAEAQVRDHLPQMLQSIADDLRVDQSQMASVAKSRGMAAAAELYSEADGHGLQRAQVGVSINQLVAEYRALRASVLRLWSEHSEPGKDTIRDIGRFNESIDQAIAESVRAFATETEMRRQFFLAALGHDLRGPLHAVVLSAQAVEIKAPPGLSAYTRVLSRSAARMSTLLESLLDFNIVGLGGRMTLKRSTVDLQSECEEEMEILQAALPKTTLQLRTSGDCWGEFDASRIREALSNLVTNAARHGVTSTPVVVKVHGSKDAVQVVVTNAIEDRIPSSELALLFEPTRRRAAQAKTGERSHLGLGLFITREIAKSHGGDATALCHDDKISFTILLPKGGQVALKETAQ
jgi:signal transduction histidine kinase